MICDYCIIHYVFRPVQNGLNPNSIVKTVKLLVYFPALYLQPMSTFKLILLQTYEVIEGHVITRKSYTIAVYLYYDMNF